MKNTGHAVVFHTGSWNFEHAENTRPFPWVLNNEGHGLLQADLWKQKIITRSFCPPKKAANTTQRWKKTMNKLTFRSTNTCFGPRFKSEECHCLPQSSCRATFVTIQRLFQTSKYTRAILNSIVCACKCATFVSSSGPVSELSLPSAVYIGVEPRQEKISLFSLRGQIVRKSL